MPPLLIHYPSARLTCAARAHCVQAPQATCAPLARLEHLGLTVTCSCCSSDRRLLPHGPRLHHGTRGARDQVGGLQAGFAPPLCMPGVLGCKPGTLSRPSPCRHATLGPRISSSTAFASAPAPCLHCNCHTAGHWTPSEPAAWLPLTRRRQGTGAVGAYAAAAVAAGGGRRRRRRRRWQQQQPGM